MRGSHQAIMVAIRAPIFFPEHDMLKTLPYHNPVDKSPGNLYPANTVPEFPAAADIRYKDGYYAGKKSP